MTPRRRNTGQAVEYLRRSIERDKSADRDRGSAQRASNAAEAERDGATISRTFDGDWGISGGRGARAKRTAMAELIEAVRAGQVSTIYCRTADRLARDVELGMTLWNACADAGTIIAAGSQRFDPRSPGFLTHWSILLAQAQETLEAITTVNQGTQDWLGDHATTCPKPGRPHLGRCHEVGGTDETHCEFAHEQGRKAYGRRPGEDAAAVVAAVREAESLLGGARRLNEAGVPAWAGGVWCVRSVRRIIVREAPELIPLNPRRGARTVGRHILSGLLTCPCGRTLTSQPTAWGVSYLCSRGLADPNHDRPYQVAESKLIEWTKREAARWRIPATQEQADKPDHGILDRRRRLVRAYADGMPDEEYAERMAALAADEAAHERKTRIIRLPKSIDFEQPATANAILRNLWDHVALDAAMRPVRAAWMIDDDELGPEQEH